MGRPRGFDTLNCTENDVWEIEKHENATNLRYGKGICYGRWETPDHNYDNYYTYLVYPEKGKKFSDINGREGSYFGISLVLRNQKVKEEDVIKLGNLLNEVYNIYIYNKYIKEYGNGNIQWMVEKLDEKMYQNIANGLNEIIKSKPELSIHLIDENSGKAAYNQKNNYTR